MGVGGIGTEVGAVFEFLFGVAIVVGMTGELDGRTVGGVGLDEDFTFDFAASGASGDLGEELEGAFGGAEVGEVEGEVGIENADEGDVGEVEAFGDHLGADEEVDFLGAEVAQGVAELVFAVHDVGVDAGDASGGEDGAQGGFSSFGSEAAEEQRGGVALGAFFGREGTHAADVADEAVVGFVEGEGDVAVGAADGGAAVEAGDGGVESAAVEKKDDLFALVEPALNGDAQDFGEDGDAVFGFAFFEAHVDDADQREGFVVGAFGEVEMQVFAGAGVGPGFE